MTNIGEHSGGEYHEAHAKLSSVMRTDMAIVDSYFPPEEIAKACLWLASDDAKRVNTIYPGLIDTDMTHGMMAYPQLVEQFQAKIPLGRFGKPEDIAYGVLFLASDASSFMTGQHLVMDGGQLM